MISMKKTLLSVLLLSTASAFSMEKVRGMAQKAINHKYSAVVAPAVVYGVTQNTRQINEQVTAVNNTVAKVLKVDNQAIARTALVELLCQVAARSTANAHVKNVVHATRAVNATEFVANSGHLDVLVNRLPEALRNSKTRFVLAAAAVYGYKLAKDNAVARLQPKAEVAE